MIFVFGGAYQGKTDYALQEFGAETVSDISEAGEPDFSKDVVTGIEGFVSRCAEQGREANGRLMIYLAKEADQVHRVFCGIGKRIK